MSGRQLVWLSKVFDHLQEYLSKDSLDALVCLQARAAVEEGVLRDHLGGRLERFALPDRFFPWPHEIVADAAKIDYPALTAIAQLLSTGGRQGST
jgi:hypothetical protein